jgi:hypothetical protein
LANFCTSGSARQVLRRKSRTKAGPTSRPSALAKAKKSGFSLKTATPSPSLFLI